MASDKKRLPDFLSSPTRYLPEKAIQIFHLQIPAAIKSIPARSTNKTTNKISYTRARLSIPPHTAYPAVSNTRIRIGKRLPCNQPLLYHVRKDICPVSCHTGKIDQQ